MKRWLSVLCLLVTIALALGPPCAARPARAGYGAYAGPPDPLAVPPGVDIRTLLQRYLTPGDPAGVEPSACDRCQLEVDGAQQPSEPGEPGIQAGQTFTSIADTAVIQQVPAANFGDTVDMWAGYDVCMDPDARIARSLVRFDLSGLPGGQAIARATLRLRQVSSCGYAGQEVTIRTYRITDSWSEMGATWNNQPGYGGSYGSVSVPHAVYTWYEFDVTDLVRQWYTGQYANDGIMLRGPESSSSPGWRGFSTREGPYPPQLVVEYGAPPPPEVTGITPSSGSNEGTVHITDLSGAYLKDGATVKLAKAGEADINATNVDVVSASRITCDLDLTGAATGAWDVTVTNPDGQSGTLPGGFAITGPVTGTWMAAPSPTLETLESTHFSSASDGWAVGQDGTILHYDGGGWRESASPTAWDLASVHGLSASDVWAVGENGTLLHYEGSAWSTVDSSTTRDLESIHMLSGSDGWAVGAYGTILHYDGLAWTEGPRPVTERLESVYMVSASEGWIVGYNGTILRYNGSAWTAASSPTGETLTDVHMVSANDGWAVGNSGTILRYQGGSWTNANSPTSAGLASVHVTAAGRGWAVGNVGVSLYYDGNAWAESPEPDTSNALRAVHMVSAGEGWIVGGDGLILYYADPPPAWGPTVRRVSPGGASNDGSVRIDYLQGGNFQDGAAVRLRRAGQPDVPCANVYVRYSTDIRCDLELTGVAAGLWDVVVTNPGEQSGTLPEGFLVADPLPDEWETVPSPVSAPTLRGIYMVSAGHGWAVGTGGTILRYDGAAWATASSPTDRALYSVHCVGAGGCWAVGASGTILHHEGGAWVEVDSPTSRYLYAVHMLTADSGWAVGSLGTILRCERGQWSQIASPTSNSLSALAMRTASDGWAVGWYGTILRYDGSRWSQVASPTSSDLAGVGLASAAGGWAVGSYGRLLHHDGSTWTKQTCPTRWGTWNAVHVASAADGWTVGSAGDILHHDGTGWVPVSSPTSKWLYALHALPTGEAWAVGSSGVILHYPSQQATLYLPVLLNRAFEVEGGY